MMRSKNITISFKFSVFDLEIEHKILKEFGEFTIFCMKAISSDLKIKDISNIIQIKDEIIKKQLAFAISRKYLTEDFILTSKGIEVIDLFEFINIFNQKKVKIALEHYIKNNSKQLYSIDNIKFEEKSTGNLVKDIVFDYGIRNKFHEIIENDTSKIKPFLLKDFVQYNNIIEKYLEDFIFKIFKGEKEIFYNYLIREDNFMDKLEDIKDRFKSHISIDIPVLEIDKDIKSTILNEELISKIKYRFNKYRYLNLINGKPITCRKYERIVDINLKIKSKINNNNLFEELNINEKISLNELLFIDIQTNTKEFYETKFLDITDIMDNI